MGVGSIISISVPLGRKVRISLSRLGSSRMAATWYSSGTEISAKIGVGVRVGVLVCVRVGVGVGVGTVGVGVFVGGRGVLVDVAVGGRGVGVSVGVGVAVGRATFPPRIAPALLSPIRVIMPRMVITLPNVYPKNVRGRNPRIKRINVPRRDNTARCVA